jgi:hypothetical protein
MRHHVVKIVTAVVLAASATGCSPATNGGSATRGSQPSASTDQGPSASQGAAASAVCDEAARQLSTLSGGAEVLLLQCGAQSNGEGEVALVLGLNDWMEWTTLMSEQALEDVVFTVPLSLVAYAFGGSGEDPETFDRILIAFSDESQSVYDLDPRDLGTALAAQTLEEARAAILALRDTVRITSLG